MSIPVKSVILLIDHEFELIRYFDVYEWYSFASCGDEWLIAYASIKTPVISPLFFTIGHALELYLKAAYAKRFSVTEAMKKGHDLLDIWKDLKSKDPAFMDGYEIRQSIYDIEFLNHAQVSSLSWDDQKHLLTNSELYIIFKYLQNLKYMGLPWKPLQKGETAMGLIPQNTYWISFFQLLRKNIGYPAPNRADTLKDLRNLGWLNADVSAYLQALID